MRWGGVHLDVAMHLSSSAPTLAAPDRTRLLELIDRQMWFFGCDIRHPAGNLLLTHGFTRDRAPADIPGGTSRYTRRTREAPDGAQLVLWGWGALWISDAGDALAVRRHVTMPKWLVSAPNVSQMWQYQALDALLERAAPADTLVARRRLADFAAWVVTYEQWVRAETPPAWRTQCVEERPRHIRRRHSIADDAYLDAWQSIAA